MEKPRENSFFHRWQSNTPSVLSHNEMALQVTTGDLDRLRSFWEEFHEGGASFLLVEDEGLYPTLEQAFAKNPPASPPSLPSTTAAAPSQPRSSRVAITASEGTPWFSHKPSSDRSKPKTKEIVIHDITDDDVTETATRTPPALPEEAPRYGTRSGNRRKRPLDDTVSLEIGEAPDDDDVVLVYPMDPLAVVRGRRLALFPWSGTPLCVCV